MGLNPGWNEDVRLTHARARSGDWSNDCTSEEIDRDRQGDKDPTGMALHPHDMNQTVIVAKSLLSSRALCLSFSATYAPSILSLFPSYVPYLAIEIKLLAFDEITKR